MQRSALPFARPRSSSLSLLCLGLISVSATAASIEFVGIETGVPVQNWSNDEVPKAFDLNNDDRFGGAGYYQITPGVFGENETWSNTVESSNDLGITQSYPTLFSKPDFLSENPLGAAGSFSNTTNSPDFMNPDGDAFIRQGALQPNFVNFTEGTVPGDVDGFGHIAFTFKLSEAAGFHIGIAVDTSGVFENSVDFVSIRQTGFDEVFSEQLSRDGLPDMVFFDINGNVNDEFVVTLWQSSDPFDQPVVFSLITFDKMPDPTLSYVLNGNSFTLSWEPAAIGWTLESSTDLGSIWTVVTDPPVVNNSVTLDITGVPKRFFRLRKDL